MLKKIQTSYSVIGVVNFLAQHMGNQHINIEVTNTHNLGHVDGEPDITQFVKVKISKEYQNLGVNIVDIEFYVENHLAGAIVHFDVVDEKGRKRIDCDHMLAMNSNPKKVVKTCEFEEIFNIQQKQIKK